MAQSSTNWKGSDPARLRAYDLALHLVDQVNELLRYARIPKSLAEQMVRCADSIVLNIAEAAAHRSAGQKSRHFEIARGSAGELIGCLDLMKRRDPRAFTGPALRNTRLLCGMLASLIDYWSSRK